MATWGENVTTILNSGYKANPNAGLQMSRFDYYSGSQISVWFGDVMLDDIVSIQWTRQQSKRPLYGYASQYFDAVANGTVIIQGSFIVNFRQSGYLSLIVGKIKSLYKTAPEEMDKETIRKVIEHHVRVGTFGPLGDNDPDKVKQNLADLGNSDNFSDLAKLYEDVIWGGGVPGEGAKVGEKEADTLRKFLPADVRQAKEIADGFNILITYGDVSGSEPKSVNEYIQSATKAILGVHLVGDSQVIQVGGQPIVEQYDFIARGTDLIQ